MIKFAVGVIAYYVYTALAKNKEEYKLFPVVTAGAVAELVMMVSYFLYEGLFIVTFAGAILGIPGYCIQGVLGVTVSYFILKVLKKTDIFKLLK